MWPLLLVVAAALAVFAAPAQASNLVVKDLTFKSTPSQSTAKRVPSVVIDSDRRGRFGLDFTIKNIGKYRSHNIHAQIFINDKKFDSQLVGPIAAGKSRTVRESYNPTFKGPGPGFDVSVCVGRNTCKHVQFTAIPRRWNVSMFKTGPNSLSGIAPFFGADSTGMTFDFFGTVREGDQYTFLWLASGGVTGYTKGNDGFCTYKGHGAVSHAQWDILPPETGYLETTTKLDSYYAKVVDENHAFITTQTCPGYPPHREETEIPTLQTILSNGSHPSMEPDATTLKGSYTIPTGVGHGVTVGDWSFRADIP
jgi:hypothetical protein